MSANTAKMKPAARDAMRALLTVAAAAGRHCTVSSAWRSSDHQRELYEAWLAGDLNVPVVAPPGRSAHERGEAFDLKADPKTLEMLGKIWIQWGGGWGGTWREDRREPWHFQWVPTMRISTIAPPHA